MVTVTPLLKRPGNQIAVILGTSVLVSTVLGLYLAQSMKPFEKEITIQEFATYTINQKFGGNYSMTYLTTGPKLEDFWMSCGPTYYADLGPANNCIMIPYDGKVGAVELLIPTGLVREFGDTGSEGAIGEVQGSWYKKLAFERVSEDSSLTRIRVELPADADAGPIKVIGTQSWERYTVYDLVANASAISIVLFVCSLLVWMGAFVAASTVKKKLRSN